MNRFGAFAVHLGISVIIFLIPGYLILFHWYPDFFFASDGGWQGIRIVALVDLVLGPTLTLVVFNRAKPSAELRRDLSIIGLIQLSCLIAGTYVVYTERPVAMVFSDGTFTSMTADDYLNAGQPVPDLHDLPGAPPYWVSVRLPTDPTVQSVIRGRAIRDRTPLNTLSEYYEPFRLQDVDEKNDGLSLAEIRARDNVTPFLQDFLKSNGGRPEDYIFLPFGTRYSLALIAIRRADGKALFLEVPGGRLSATADVGGH